MAPGWGSGRGGLGRLRLRRADGMTLRREAAAAGEVPLPVVQAAGEHAVFDLAGLGQVGAQMWAAPLHHPLLELDVLALVGLLGVPVLDVLDPVAREALEDGREEQIGRAHV